MAKKGEKAQVPELVPLDMSLAVENNHPQVDCRKWYLVRWDGRWAAGKFKREWYGLNFQGFQWYDSGVQFDAPGTNESRWEGIWEIRYS